MPEIFEKNRKIKVIEYGSHSNDLDFSEIIGFISAFFGKRFSRIFGA